MTDLSPQLQAMRAGGKKLSRIRDELLVAIKPGISLSQLDILAETLITQTGGQPAFKQVPGYHWTTCINVNAGVVHGIPDSYILRQGDIVSLDIGLYYQGFYTDTSVSIGVGQISPEAVRFLQAGRVALKTAINTAKPGYHVGHISQALETSLRKYGYQPITTLTGHGIGRQLHQFPPIPGFLTGDITTTPKLEPGMTLAIEAIYTQGNPEVITEADGWTITTRDGKLAGLFEETVAVTPSHPLVLTA